MSEEEQAFIAMLDEYFRALTASRAATLLSPSAHQTRIDQARMAIIQEWQYRFALQRASAGLVQMVEKLGAAGDRIAHELIYNQHPVELEAWWQARGGHNKCTVCGTEPPVAVVGGPPHCGCVASDAWQCARSLGECVFVTCQCVCHRRGSGAGLLRASA